MYYRGGIAYRHILSIYRYFILGRQSIGILFYVKQIGVSKLKKVQHANKCVL